MKHRPITLRQSSHQVTQYLLQVLIQRYKGSSVVRVTTTVPDALSCDCFLLISSMKSVAGGLRYRSTGMTTDALWDRNRMLHSDRMPVMKRARAVAADGQEHARVLRRRHGRRGRKWYCCSLARVVQVRPGARHDASGRCRASKYSLTQTVRPPQTPTLLALTSTSKLATGW